MSSPNVGAREQAIAEHFGALSQETAALVREELRLVREDLTEQGKRLGAGAGLLGAAGLLGLGAFGALTSGFVSAFGGGARGGIVVATLYGGGAAALAMSGRERLREVAPEAVATVGRDVQAAAAGTRSGA